MKSKGPLNAGTVRIDMILKNYYWNYRDFSWTLIVTEIQSSSQVKHFFTQNLQWSLNYRNVNNLVARIRQRNKGATAMFKCFLNGPKAASDSIFLRFFADFLVCLWIILACFLWSSNLNKIQLGKQPHALQYFGLISCRWLWDWHFETFRLTNISFIGVELQILVSKGETTHKWKKENWELMEKETPFNSCGNLASYSSRMKRSKREF